VSAEATPVTPGSVGRVGGLPRRPLARRRAAGRRYVVALAVAVVLVALVRSLLVQSFVVPTGSMDPTVRVGDRVLVSRFSYLFGDVRHGDVVVFDGAGVFEPAVPPASSPLAQAGRGLAAAFGVPVGAHDYVKRVIALPGERVVCCDAAGRITVAGKPLAEPYLDPGAAPSATRFDVVVPAGRVWVMGDHRDASADSRSHLADPGGGTVPVDHVVGRVVGIYWPVGHTGGVGRGR
jgi:signal peptidase I